MEYLNGPLSMERLADMLDMLGKRPIDLVRGGEALLKELGLSERIGDPMLNGFMVENPGLIDCPILTSGSRVVLGRSPENILQIL